MQIKYKIKGMHCISCASKIKDKISSINGVKIVGVSFISEFIRLDYDPVKVSLREIKSEVDKLGYKLIEHEDLEKFNSIIILVLMQVCMVFSILLHFAYMLEFHFLEEHSKIYATLVLVVSVFVIVLGLEFFTRGLKRIVNFKPDQDSLVALGVGAAFLTSLYSIYQVIINSDLIYFRKIYFEEITTIISLMYLGRFIEKKANKSASDSIRKIVNLTSNKAVRLNAFENTEENIQINDIKKGDILVVKAGQAIPFDGKIIKGQAEINEAIVTGESNSVFKNLNEQVIGGTSLQNGYINILVEKDQDETFLAKIVNFIDDVEGNKSPIECLADSVASVFVVAVNIISIFTFFFWFIGFNDLKMGIEAAILILIVACPCALGLATPLSMMMAVNRAASMGILIKKSHILQTINKVHYVLLDKTGTLTKGMPIFISLHVIDRRYNEEQILAFTASIENTSKHPIASAIISEAQKRDIVLKSVSEVEVILGKGVKGNIGKELIYIGNLNYMHDLLLNVDFPLADDEKHCTQIYVATSRNIIGIINVFDCEKDNAKSFVSFLHSKNLKVGIISGDNKNSTSYIASKLKIKSYFANILPGNKEKIIRELQKKDNKVMMIGDGINDAPALARADIGVSLGSATDIAIENAEVILVNDDLMNIKNLISLASCTIRNIKQNLFWAFFYNIISIPLAGGYLSFWGISVNPLVAAFMMIFSSLLVVFNSLRLRKLKL